MNRLWISVVPILLLAACGGDTVDRQVSNPAIADSTSPAAAVAWDDFVTSVVDAWYRQYPEVAADAGLHQFDGQISDIRAESLNTWVQWLDDTLLLIDGYGTLEGLDAFERDYLRSALRGERFWLVDTAYRGKNPLYYLNRMSFSVYVDREYAPVEERIQAYTTYMQQLPDYLATMQDNLQPPLPAPYLTIAAGILEGLAGYLENTVPGLFSGVTNDQLQRQFNAANTDAVDAVIRTLGWVRSLEPTASDDYALGADRFLRMLRDTQGLDISLAELKAAGEADLKRNLDALNEACAEFLPGGSTRDCVTRMQRRKPPEGAVLGATRQLPALRRFVEDHQLASIPADEEALVAEAPPHRRFNSAYINIPGPFENGMPSVYYIAPPDPAWSAKDQLAYVPAEADLLAISVHEVWPGHFLQNLHSSRSEIQVGQHFSTYTFSEGWAHYTEQMMVDAGLGDGDPEIRIGQLYNALLRNVRYLSAIGLHAEGMTVEQSEALFLGKAFKDMGNASQQALRGTYDPGYLNYTLGKLMINKLRDDWTRGRGGREAWGAFHDEFLSYGEPPIPLIRRQMLGENVVGDQRLLP